MFTWAARNWAETNVSDPKLAPPTLPVPRHQAVTHIQAAIQKLPRWHIVSVDEANSLIKATRTTRLFRFIDDVVIRLEDAPNGATRLHIRSQSRVGKGDLGQNRRNIIELLKAASGAA